MVFRLGIISIRVSKEGTTLESPGAESILPRFGIQSGQVIAAQVEPVQVGEMLKKVRPEGACLQEPRRVILASFPDPWEDPTVEPPILDTSTPMV